MILFTILLTILAVLVAVVLTFTGVIGGAALLLFGDLIVCVFIIVFIVKLFKKKKK